jgi:uncharacterized membrane protein YedE/YeeE
MAKKNKEPMRFSKKVIILMFATMILFTVTMIVTYWVKGGVPDSLIDPFFAFFGIEGGALGVIKVSENIADKFEKKEGKKK